MRGAPACAWAGRYNRSANSLELTVNLADLQVGQTVARESMRIGRARALAYRTAVGDDNPLYDARAVTPAMAMAALAMGAAMRAVELPEGAVHLSQEASFLRAAPEEAPLDVRVAVGQNSVRRGVRFLTLEVAAESEGALVMRSSALISIKEQA
ncbi:MAG: hypothetical protein OXI25_03030 [Chloroflexota bacterium]|nr:hypothetical protein [Chloroflexota bacterium]